MRGKRRGRFLALQFGSDCVRAGLSQQRGQGWVCWLLGRQGSVEALGSEAAGPAGAWPERQVEAKGHLLSAGLTLGRTEGSLT